MSEVPGTAAPGIGGGAGGGFGGSSAGGSTEGAGEGARETWAEVPPVVSIVVVAYRTPEMIRRCLDSLEAARLGVPYEVLVIDNSPADRGCAEAADGRPSVRYVPNPTNVGFGRACNQGMRMARGRHYLMLNPDMEVLPGSIEALVELLEREPDAGIVAPRLHYPDGKLQESCRTFYTLPIFLLRRTFLGKVFPGSRIIREHLMLDWDHEDTRNVDWCIGAALLVRGEAVRDVGMMDERFFLYFEDVDWCYRMHQRGWRVLYHPASRMIHHYQRASAGWKPSRGLLLHLGSTLRYYEKWSFLLYWLKMRSRLLRNVALFSSDVLMVVAAFLLAYAIRGVAGGLLTKPLFSLELYSRFLAFTIVVAAASFLTLGLYRERMRPSWIENGLAVARALAWTAVLMMASTFLFSVRIFSRLIVLLFFPLAVVLVTAGRVALLRAVESVRRRDLNLRRLGILGPPEAVAELMDRFRRHGTFGMEPVPLAATEHAATDPEAWLRRLRAERVQEVMLFEDWPGDVRAVLRGLREQSIPVLLVPGLRGVLPAGSTLGEFMGWPALRIGADPGGPGRSPGRRLSDAASAVLLAVLLLPAFALVALARLLSRRPVTESVELRGRGGRLFRVRRLAGTAPGRGLLRHLVGWYPGLGTLLAGRVSLVGIYPFSPAEWNRLTGPDCLQPPAASPGLFGPWIREAREPEEWAAWNRRYAEEWSPAADFRIFWTSVFTGGKGDPC